MSSPLLAKQKQELLTFGYIRSTTNNENIPVELNHLCLQFYNTNIHLIFNKETLTLNKFLSMEHHQAIYSNVMKYKCIDFICSVCPNGWIKAHKGKVMFYLEIKKIPENIKRIIFICKLYCHQTNTFWQKTVDIDHTFNFKEPRSASTGWNGNALSFSECKDRADRTLK